MGPACALAPDRRARPPSSPRRVYRHGAPIKEPHGCACPTIPRRPSMARAAKCRRLAAMLECTRRRHAPTKGRSSLASALCRCRSWLSARWGSVSRSRFACVGAFGGPVRAVTARTHRVFHPGDVRRPWRLCAGAWELVSRGTIKASVPVLAPAARPKLAAGSSALGQFGAAAPRPSMRSRGRARSSRRRARPRSVCVHAHTADRTPGRSRTPTPRPAGWQETATRLRRRTLP